MARRARRKEEHLMKQYKVTISNGNYPLSCTCNTIADAFECLRSTASWAHGKVCFKSDDLMETLVQMRKNEATAITCSGYSITVIEEAD